MSSNRVRLLALAAAFVLTTSCSSQSATPTTSESTTALTTAQAPTSGSSPSTSGVPSTPTTSASSSAQPPSSSAVASSSAPTSEATLDDAAESEAALAAYRGFYEFLNTAYANPAADWSVEIKKWAAGPAADQVLAQLASLAKNGQYGTGSVQVEPEVTQVQAALVDIKACVDSTNIGLFNKDGQSIKSPDGPGTYFRHPSTAQVGQFEGGAWLVMSVSDDYSITC